MEKWYKVSASELRELIRDSLTFCALEAGGVDNWEWYSDSIHEFLSSNREEGIEDIYDIADKELQNYEEVEP